MSLFPQNWPREWLKRRVCFAYGDSLASEDRNDGDVPVFGSNGIVGAHDCSITLAPAIIIGRKGSAGRVTWSDVPCFPIDTTYFVDRTQTRENMRWLFYALESLGLDKINFDSAVPGLSRELAYSLPLVFPPLHEQRRIASYLDKTCTAIDTAIEKKQKQLETLDALRKAIIHKAVTRGLDDSVELKDSGVEWIGMIPKHWRHDHLKRVCVKIQTGTTPPTANTEYYVDGTIPWYAPGCYDGGLYLEEPSKLINELAYHDNKLRLFPAESIFLVGIGATIGKVAMTKIEASCNQQITAIVCNAEVSSKYMTYQMKIYEGIIPKISQYTTLPIMDQVKIGYLRVVIPAAIEEQELIVDYLDNKIESLNELGVNLKDQITTLEQYRKSLIHECVTGKRRITEANLKEIEAHV